MIAPLSSACSAQRSMSRRAHALKPLAPQRASVPLALPPVAESGLSHLGQWRDAVARHVTLDGINGDIPAEQSIRIYCAKTTSSAMQMRRQVTRARGQLAHIRLAACPGAEPPLACAAIHVLPSDLILSRTSRRRLSKGSCGQ